MNIVKSDIRQIVLDTEGNVHILCKGEAAARMIASGNTPEVLFEDCKEMHQNLDDLGIFKTTKSHERVVRSALQYMVYQGSLNENENPDLKYRVFTSWALDSHAPFCKELKGWGDREQDDPFLVSVPAHSDGFNKLLSTFRVVVQTPVLLNQRFTMNDNELHGIATRWKEKGLLPKNVDFVGGATAEPDPVYKGTGTINVNMQIDAINEIHAKFIARTASLPFFGELVSQMGCRNRSGTIPRVWVEPSVPTDEEQQIQCAAELNPAP